MAHQPLGSHQCGYGDRKNVDAVVEGMLFSELMNNLSHGAFCKASRNEVNRFSRVGLHLFSVGLHRVALKLFLKLPCIELAVPY